MKNITHNVDILLPVLIYLLIGFNNNNENNIIEIIPEIIKKYGDELYE